MTASPNGTPSRGLEIVGIVVLAAGMILWYATPGDVIWPPLMVMLVGGVIAFVGFLQRRRYENSQSETLTAQARANRAALLQQAQTHHVVAPAAAAVAIPSLEEEVGPGSPIPAEPPADPPPGLDLYTAAMLVADPQTPGETLMLIVQHHRSLWGHVKVHPQVYPSLATWIESQHASESGQ